MAQKDAVTETGMTWDEIEKAVVSEITLSFDQTQRKRAEKRQRNWDRYYGRQLGNERKGRSKYMSRDVMDTVEWAMPHLMRTLITGDAKVNVEIEGAEPWIGQALRDKIREDLEVVDDNPWFVTAYNWFKDSLVSDTSICKVIWELDL